jgi:hypothetical protein
MATKSFFLNNSTALSNQLQLSKSSPRSQKGNTVFTDLDGKRFPRGFTPPTAFITNPDDTDPRTNNPKELGFQITNRFNPIDQSDIQKTINDNYYLFNDQPGYEFIHLLDRNNFSSSSNEIYLTSFLETSNDNEDPVSFGYDIIIDFDHSPLFNGSIENFLNSDLFRAYSELSSRVDLVKKFKEQFFKFFKTNSPISSGQRSVPKTYYLHKITGLDQLTEVLGGDKVKQFVDYDKDVLTLTLNEDISVNTGYLASLYKMLSYSKINGKKMIPDNLLRFDMEIIVTEIRKYNRVVDNKRIDAIQNFADAMSKYRYRLYECQFIFDKFSHDGTLDMSEPTISKGFDLKINYKFTTMKFEKFLDKESILNDNNSISRKQDFVNNAKNNIYAERDVTGKLDSEDVGFVVINGSIQLRKYDYILGNIDTYYVFNNKREYSSPDNLKYSGEYSSAIDALDANSKQDRKSSLAKLLDKTKDNIISSANNSLKNAIYTIKQELYAFIPTNFLGGFTEDGWQYNIPAYYTNKIINTSRNAIQKTLQSVRGDIYAAANAYKLKFLNNINIGINQGTNLLNNALGRLPGAIDKLLTGNSSGLNPKNKPNNIYGNTSFQPINYSGAYRPTTPIGYRPTPNNSGFSRDGFQYNLPAWNRNNRLRIVGAIRNNNTTR